MTHSRSAFPAAAWPRPLARKMRALTAWLEACSGGLLTAWSGGTDSTFLAVLAARVLGEKALAVTVDMPLLPRADLREARALAKRLGLRHRVIKTSPMTDSRFLANRPDRCYWCKAGLCRLLRRVARETGLGRVADGSNADDLLDYRPGARAAREQGICQPLQELGFTKADIRAASRVMRLPTADTPAAACLASRIPYGTPVTAARLKRIERAEQALHALGFARCRVRLHGDVGRIELPPSDLEAAVRRRAAVAAALRQAGVPYAALDLEGYRMGSLNETTGRATASRSGTDGNRR